MKFMFHSNEKAKEYLKLNLSNLVKVDFYLII